MRRSILVGACAVLLAAVGCDDDDDGVDGVDGAGLEVATYNAGLAPGFVPLAQERAPRVVEAVADQPLDVLCVQEFWLPEHVQALQAATAEDLPNTIFPPPDPGDAVGDEPACTPADLAPLAGCVQASCGDVASDALAGCVLASCETELAGVLRRAAPRASRPTSARASRPCRSPARPAAANSPSRAPSASAF